MTQISASSVKELRERTDLPMMDCKKALIEAEGDMDKAIDLLRSQFKNVAVKKGERETAEGRIAGHYDPAKKVGALVEVQCESAPVAKSDPFIKLADQVAKQVALTNPPSVEALLGSKFVDESSKTINELITDTIGLIRENMKVARFLRTDGPSGYYCHHDGSVGAILQVEGEPDNPQVLRDVCMHITATNPVAGTKDEFPKEVIEKERQIAILQTKEDPKMAGKPDEIVEKSVQGKLNKWLAQNSLLDQPFVKDETKTVGDILKSAVLKFVRFARYRVGEK